MLTNSSPMRPYKACLLFFAGPILFLLGIVGCSIFFSIRGLTAEQIPEQVTALMPNILLGVLSCLGILLSRFSSQVKGTWVISDFRKALLDIVFGLLAGTVLAVLYLCWLGQLLETLQRTLGDFVPPGSVLQTVSGNIGLFFIANVVLAPIVEETLYRGIAIPWLAKYVSPTGAFVVSCTLFGLFHWAGGFWYMLLTGVVAGGSFAGLYFWRGSVLAPFVAHLVLNLIEFGYAWHLQI